MDQRNIRNFCIIAHIDHGKSTLADRLLEYTGAVEKRKLREQMLDTMELERERGITIKLQPARMRYNPSHPPLASKGEEKEFELNLIDTPGHVDFTYEVSRSLAAVEGALLLVDASQGVQAQTIGNLHLALEQGLAIIPVVNKIDLPGARVEETVSELVGLLGCKPEEIIRSSGKTGEGVPEILVAVVNRIPPPKGSASAPARALIFDSKYDEFKGVVAYVRVFDGSFSGGQKIKCLATGAESEALETGFFKPEMTRADSLGAGEIGYITTGLKELKDVRVGDTIALSDSGVEPLAGYREVKPMVFAGIFAKEGSNFTRLRSAIEKLQLNDAALTFEPSHSSALGFGFQVGTLGLLHLEIVEERLRREYDLELVVTMPSVAYRLTTTDKQQKFIKSPVEFPDRSKISQTEEPWVKVDIVTPAEYIGAVLRLAAEKRGAYLNTEYLGSGSRSTVSGQRAILHFELPLASILVDFYDKLKSASSGYASMSYEFLEYRSADIVRLEIRVAEQPVEALFSLVPEAEAYRIGRAVVESLKQTVPRQQFEVKLQAVVGGKVIAAERIAPFRKDVLAKLSGGDWTRKMKLLQKQKKGKARLSGAGQVDIPTEAYLAVLKKST